MTVFPLQSGVMQLIKTFNKDINTEKLNLFVDALKYYYKDFLGCDTLSMILVDNFMIQSYLRIHFSVGFPRRTYEADAISVT